MVIEKTAKCSFRWLTICTVVLVFFFTTPVNVIAAEHKGSSSPAAKLIDKPFYQALDNSHQLAERFGEQLSGFVMLPGEMVKVWKLTAVGHSTGYPFLLILQICFVLLSAIIVESFLRKRLETVYRNIATVKNSAFISNVSCRGIGIVLESLFLLSFVLVTFGLFIFIFPEQGTAVLVASNYLLAAYYIRVLFFLITVFLSPKRPTLRILPFSDRLAKFLFFWSMTICSVEIVLSRSATILKKSGADESALLALTGVIIVSSAIMFAILLQKCRPQVIDTLCISSDEDSPSLPCQFATYWQFFSLTVLFFIIIIWEVRVLDSGGIHFGKIIVAFLAIPIFLSFDIWGGRLLRKILTKRSADSSGGFLEKTGVGQYTSQIQLVYRILLLSLLFFFFLGLFKIDVAIGRMFTAGILSSIFIVIAVYLAWQFFTSWVDRKILEEMPADDEEMDEGGKGGSRRGTLLLLLRKFVLILLVIITAMLILSALGLNIAPLIAGAGILGLAVSFGAQSLVTDIFSGIFFLIDDAFRVGDYIDTGTAKGLVEHISLRAVRLRHHRGMVQTVPFGKIGTVVNFSRDYIIMKLDFRVKYDTDVDKVRKIVKKMYKNLLLDEELGPKLIGKLKSQGVRKMDDSAMIMRIKFTTPPGEQFVMRKEILRRLQEAFKENDIEFAHRNVTVYMPENEGHEMTSTEVQGAATAAILNEEIQAGNTKNIER